MDNMNWERWKATMNVVTMTFVFAMRGLAENYIRETYIRNPKVKQNKYNRVKDLAYNHRKKRVRKKNLNRLAESQILIYAGWDWINGGEM